MRFNPKKYLDKRINQDNCDHEILITNGFDEGMYGSRYECLICGKEIYVSIYGESPDKKHFIEKNHFIKSDYGCLTPNLKIIMLNLLKKICLNSREKKYIDIIDIFKNFEPFIDSEIKKNIKENLKPENKQKILKKYENLF